MFGFLKGLNRVGTFGAEAKAQFAADGVLYLEEKVAVARHFSGHVPGVFSSTGVARYTGAIALTPNRAVATFPASGDAGLVAMDCGWGLTTGAAHATFAADGLRIDIDLRRVDHAFSGSMSLRYQRAIAEHVLSQLPCRTVSFAVTPAFVYRAAGVRPRT